MTNRLHLLPGSSAAGSAAPAFPDDDIVHIHDAFTEGPVRPLESHSSVREWLRARWNWWQSRPGAVEQGVPDEYVDEFCDVFAQFDGYDEVVVWSADGLGENLFACWVVVAVEFEGHDLTKLRLASPCVDQTPWPGGVYLGACEPQSYAQGTWRRWDASELDAAHLAWKTFTAPTPARLLELTGALPDVDFVAVLPEILGRYPSADIGLDVWEERLLRRIDEATEVTARTIGEVLADGWEQTHDHIGDQTLFDRLLELSDPSAPERLMRRWGSGLSMSATYFALTERGKAVLEGGESRIDSVGLDRWIGGVHLDSATGEVWCRDGSTLELRAFADAPERSARAALSPLEAPERYPTDKVHVVVSRGFRPVSAVVPGERVWMLPPLTDEQTAPITDLEEWLEQSGSTPVAGEFEDFPNVTPSDDKLESLIASLSQAARVCMWAGQAPSERLLAAALASKLRSLGREPFDIVCLCSPDEAAPGQGIGDMHPVVLEQTECEDTTEVLEAWMLMWEAFVSSTPKALTELLQEDALDPGARRVLDYMLGRFPDETTGLSVGEEHAFSCIDGKDHWTFHKAMSFVERLSDTTLNKPLLSRTSADSYYWPGAFEFTDFGRRVFEGEANHVDANGIDRWIGGMHLSSANGQVWWRKGRQIV